MIDFLVGVRTVEKLMWVTFFCFPFRTKSCEGFAASKDQLCNIENNFHTFDVYIFSRSFLIENSQI